MTLCSRASWPRRCAAGVYFLLSGADAGYLRESTVALTRCFNQRISRPLTDLPLTGLNLPFMNGEQEESYDRQVIEFFDKSLRAPAEARP